MGFMDLRQWITVLEKEAELRRIAAEVDWKFQRRAEWGGERFPPTVRPAPEAEARVRWAEYSLGAP